MVNVVVLLLGGSGLILFMTIKTCFCFTALDRPLPSVVFSFAIDTLLDVSHLCFFVSKAVLISLLRTTWNRKMKRPCERRENPCQVKNCTLRE